MVVGRPLFTHVTRQALSIVILLGQIKSSSEKGTGLTKGEIKRNGTVITIDEYQRCLDRIADLKFNKIPAKRIIVLLVLYIACRIIWPGKRN